MRLRTLMLTGVAFVGLVAAVALPVNAAGVDAGGSATAAAGSSVSGAGDVGGGAGGGLSGSVGPASGAIGNGTDIGAPTPSSPNATGSGTIKATTPASDVGTSAGASTQGPAVGISGSTGAQATAPGTPGVPVASLANPNDLQSATVQSRDGASIGTIDGVKMGPDGKASTISVSLADSVAGAKEISLIPDQLSFDQSNKLVVSSLSQTEIDSLAAAQKQTK